MKKTCTLAQLYSFSVLLAFTASCNAQAPKDLSKESIPPITSSGQQIGEHIFEIFEDSKANLWFGTAKNGVVKFDGKKLTNYTEKDGLCGSTVADIAEDKSGNLWFGTHMDLCKYGNNTFSTLPRKDGIPILGWGWKDLWAGWKSVRSNRDKSIWVNTHHGIFRCDDPSLPIDQLKFTEFKVPVNENISGMYCNTPGAVSLDLEDSHGNFWFGTDGDGIYKYDGKTFTHFNKENGLLTNNVTAITEDAKGNIWIACVQSLISKKQNDGGVCKYDGNKFHSFPDLKGLTQNNVYTLYSDRSGNVWIGANGVGVYRYNALESEVEKNFTLFKEPKEVKLEATGYTTGLQSVLEDSKGRFWFGYSGGLFRLDGTKLVNITTEGPWVQE